MKTSGKKFRAAVATVDRARAYTLGEAVALVKGASFAKFDETVDIAVRLGVDPRHADQVVRGTVVLPHGTGKTVKVLVITQGDGSKREVTVTLRIDTAIEVDYYKHGGILPFVLRQLLAA